MTMTMEMTNELSKKEMIEAIGNIVELTQEDIDDLWDGHSEKEVAEVLVNWTNFDKNLTDIDSVL